VKKPSQISQIRKQIKELTVRQFHQHLKNGLQHLPLHEDICRSLLDFLDRFPEPVLLSPDGQWKGELSYPWRAPATYSPRERILNFLGDVPTDPQFWGGLGSLEMIEQASHGQQHIDQFVFAYFSGEDGDFVKHWDSPPPTDWQDWVESAHRVTLVLDCLRAGARAIKPGRPKELTDEERPRSRNQSASRSKAKARWLKKFEKYKAVFGDAKQARKQVLMDFDASSRIKASHQRALIRQELDKELRKRVAAER
jgi:hypothetical protein